MVGDGRGAQRKQRARVVKKKGSGVRKRGDGGVVKGISQMEQYDQGMGNRGEVFMTWEGFEPGTWSLELWDLKRFELRTL